MSGRPGKNVVMCSRAGYLPVRMAAQARRTDRASGIRIGEAHALGGQPVHIGRAMVFAAVAAQVGPTEVVEQDEHNIRSHRLQRQPADPPGG